MCARARNVAQIQHHIHIGAAHQCIVRLRNLHFHADGGELGCYIREQSEIVPLQNGLPCELHAYAREHLAARDGSIAGNHIAPEKNRQNNGKDFHAHMPRSAFPDGAPNLLERFTQIILFHLARPPSA